MPNPDDAEALRQNRTRLLPLPEIDDAEVLEELEGEIAMYRTSYRERDGVVRDEYALHTIAALRSAISAVRTRVRMKGGR